MNITGSSNCEACPAGTYSSMKGASVCLACSSGGTFSAFWCNSNTSSSNVECIPGTYSNTSSSSECEACPLGTFSSINGATTCLTCYSSNISGASTCAFCPAGTFQFGELDASVCASEGQPCPCNSTMMFGPAHGWLPSTTGFLSCSKDGFANSKEFWNGTSSCQCITGCTPCSYGKYSTALAASSPSTCLSCPKGTYNSNGGMLNCTLCQPGSFGGGIGLTRCTNCAAGTYLPFGGATSPKQCIPCVSGMYSAQSGLRNCTVCPTGKFQASDGQTSCLLCTAGKYSNTTGKSSCSNCPSKMTSFSGANNINECYCLPGLANAFPGGPCVDVNECSGQNPCGSLKICVNTEGSFNCVLNHSKGLSFCHDPYPGTCGVTGGDLLWVNVLGGAVGTPNATAKFSTAGVSVGVYWAGVWAQIKCPQSQAVGPATATIVRTGGQTICAFTVVFTPAPISASPSCLPLAGGAMKVDLSGWNKAVNAGRCQILVGGESAGFISMTTSGPNIFNVNAPAKRTVGPAAIEMECDSTYQRLELGTVQYAGQPIAILNNGLPCIQFRSCQVFFTFWNPPCFFNASCKLVLISGEGFEAGPRYRQAFNVSEVQVDRLHIQFF